MYTAESYRIVQTLEEAYELLAKSRRNRLIGGGMWLRMGHQRFGTLIDLTALGLNHIEEIDGEIRIGAMCSLRDLETSPLLTEVCGDYFAKSLKGIVGVQFRNCATIGASVYSGYGFSDPVGALLALNAEVELYKGGRMPLETFLSQPHTVQNPDILTYLYLKKEKVTAAAESLRQSATDFPVLNLHAVLSRGQYTIAVGARPGVAIRCKEAEKALQAGDEAAARAAVMALPYGSNMRGSAEYRRQMAAVLLSRALKAMEGAK